ncbi:MAG: O-antigen ligase family protein [Planctomycetota bacterium]
MNIPDNMTLQATVEQDIANSSGSDSKTWSGRFAWLARILILAALLISPWLIGSVGHRAQFWIAAALLMSLALWWFETALNKRNTQVLPYIAIFLFVGILFGLLQVTPLGSGWQDSLLGRQVALYGELEVGAEEATGASTRISLDTIGTWQQIQLLVIALSGLLLCCRYFRSPEHLTLFFTAMTLNGVAISLFGIFQKFASDGKQKQLFWSIPLELGGTPFGPFVNRNNAAGYLLLCLASAIGLMMVVMAVKKNRGPIPIISKEIPFWRQMSHQILYFISELTAVKLASLIGIVFISAGIIGSLSRGGVLALLVAVVLTLLSYGVAKKPKNVGLILLPISLAVILLTGWLGFSNDLVSRFDELDSTMETKKWDARIQTWTDTWNSVGEMGYLGSGLGSYDEISRLYRTDKEVRIFKHAENQFVQTLVETGWWGLAVLGLTWILAFHYSYFLINIGQSASTVAAGTAGVFLLWSQLLAACFDFGLYVPANMLAMACTMGVVSYYAHSMAYRLKQKSFLRFQFDNSIAQVLLVIVFASTTLVALDLNRKGRIESLKSPVVLDQNNLRYKEVDTKIQALKTLVDDSPSIVGLNELGRLGIHRARLELFEFFKSEQGVAETNDELLKRIWASTSLVRLQETSEQLRRQAKISQENFLKLESLQVNLPFSTECFNRSLDLSPMQPEVHVVLGEIISILHGIDSARPYLERGIGLAPVNALLLRQVAVLYLQAGRFAMAAPHLKNYLALVPKDFALMLEIATMQMEEENGSVDQELILSQMLPDDPSLIYEFATRYAEPDSLVQKTALEKAEALLDEVSQSELYVAILRGKIKFAMNDLESAVDYLKAALIKDPTDDKVRLVLVNALVEQERYEEGLEYAVELIRSNDQNRRYKALYDSIKSKINGM